MFKLSELIIETVKTQGYIYWDEKYDQHLYLVQDTFRPGLSDWSFACSRWGCILCEGTGLQSGSAPRSVTNAGSLGVFNGLECFLPASICMPTMMIPGQGCALSARFDFYL